MFELSIMSEWTNAGVFKVLDLLSIFMQVGLESVSKNQAWEVIEIRDERRRRNDNPLKKWIIPHFCDVTWLIFETLCKASFRSFLKRVKISIGLG